ncbi:pathogenesis-related genes transcriptional activator [Chlorella sorokiniana]|uniref:Pathogenesis-related genes transcriptional activator n=1 Tax=Chlorella sorokiniana TaxID=3076 RepID=A0A2P6TB95_CHLSO|nr:pathogenesis-related genes transcriptional activator [Chlorella sorokiniana]|eukprot:PRW05820.1 pathogenesis-related genes transcriptional activator [Chlorella sorokiniana]
MGGSGSAALHLEGMAGMPGASTQLPVLPIISPPGSAAGAYPQLPLMDLSLPASHSLPALSSYGMLGMPGMGGLLPLPVPGMTIEQPLPSLVVGRMDSKQAEAPAGGFLQGGDLAGAVVADASAALSLEQQQQLFMAQYQQQQLLFMQRHQELLEEHGFPGQAASGSHSVTVAGIDHQAPAPPELAEPTAGPAARSRRTRRRTAVLTDGSGEGEDGGSGSEGETPKRQRRAGVGATRRRTRVQRSEGGERKESSSRFRGVTKHRRSGRFEAHIWVKDLGRQVYLGGYEQEEHAAEAYDIAVLKTKGRHAKTNFGVDKYESLLASIDKMSVEELVMAVRRQSQGFSRGTSSYRGVTHHPSGRWEARIGVPGSKHVYLGLFNAETEAARAYDRALVRLRGPGAATNFTLSDYRTELAQYHQVQQKSLQGDTWFVQLLSTPTRLERFLRLGDLSERFSDDDEEEAEQGKGAPSQGALSQGQPKQEQQKQEQQEQAGGQE